MMRKCACREEEQVQAYNRETSSDSHVRHSDLFADRVFRILIVLVTNVFLYLLIRNQKKDSLSLPRLYIGSGVVECGFNFQMPRIEAPQAGRYAQHFSVRVAPEPRFVIETRCV